MKDGIDAFMLAVIVLTLSYVLQPVTDILKRLRELTP